MVVMRYGCGGDEMILEWREVVQFWFVSRFVFLFCCS